MRSSYVGRDEKKKKDTNLDLFHWLFFGSKKVTVTHTLHLLCLLRAKMNAQQSKGSKFKTHNNRHEIFTGSLLFRGLD